MLTHIEIQYTYANGSNIVKKRYEGTELKKVEEVIQGLKDLQRLDAGYTPKDDSSNFYIDMLHNMEEMAELQKEVSKWGRGTPRFDKMDKEINDVEIALANIKRWRNKL
jgi:hypothetical protein